MSEVPEGWAVVKLGDIVEVLDKYRIPLDEEYRRTIPGPYPYCGATGVIDHINDYIFDGEYLLVAEDGGKYGPFEETAYIMRGKFWANNHVHILKGKSGVVENVFLMYYLNLIDVRKHILGTTRGKLNQEALRNIPMLKPPLPEQRKIAEVLSKVDSLIEKTEKIIEKYERIKRGLAQDLLTRGIDENGRIRSEETHEFKDSPIGRIPKEWKVVKLGNSRYSNIIMGQSPPSDSYNAEGHGLPFLQGSAEFGHIYPTIQFYTTNPLKVAHKDSVLISVRAPVGEVNVAPCDVCIGRGLAAIEVNPTHVDPKFLYYSLKIQRRILEKFGSGSTFDAITSEILQKFEMSLPPLLEQRRIAQVLSRVDNILNKERRELEKIKRLKRGLMEDLLSGKIRVTSLLEV